jgi:hypothetical protein
MSSSLHLYAVLDRPPDPIPAHGAFGERLVAVHASSLVAVAGALESTPEAEPAAALAHAELVEALARRARAILPSRFGVRFDGAEALAEAVDADASSLRSALASVRDCVEVGLTAVFPLSQPDEPRSGREYLERRLAETQAIDALVRDVHRPLEQQARDARLTHGIAPLRFSAAYLVERDEVDAFLVLADEVGSAPEIRLVQSGPWPPYSFATAGEGAS